MSGSIKGRGAAIQPANPYLPIHVEADLEQVEGDQEYLAQLGRPPTEYLTDEAQSIVAENDSPDVGFRYSVNPYRGCSHGCSYCYARPGHEWTDAPNLTTWRLIRTNMGGPGRDRTCDLRIMSPLL